MKKIYILAIAAFAFTLNMNAQFTDDAESYDLGDMGSQNLDVWGVWSGSPNPAEDIDVVNDFALSGSQSLYVDDTGAMDVYVINTKLRCWTMGHYNSKHIFPAGRGAYMNNPRRNRKRKVLEMVVLEYLTLVTYTLTKEQPMLVYFLMRLQVKLKNIQKMHGFQLQLPLILTLVLQHTTYLSTAIPLTTIHNHSLQMLS